MALYGIQEARILHLPKKCSIYPRMESNRRYLFIHVCHIRMP